MPLDLIVPDLLPSADSPEAMRALRLPWIERWLARAEPQRLAHRGLESWLARAFSLPDPPPVAAVTLAADDRPREGAWLRADPVHLRLATDAVTLHDASALEVTREEAAALVGALQDHFAGDGLEFVAPAPDRWYVRVPTGEVPRTKPLAEAIGRNVFGLLPRGEGKIKWPAAITEAQMVLGAHPVNQAREDAGKPAINSVWFWGEGVLGSPVRSSYALVYANDAFARGLGKLAGVATHPTPRGFPGVDAVRADEWVLVVDDRLTLALRAGGEPDWSAAARALEEAWFASLGDALDRFDGMRIVLPGPRDTLVATVSPNARWRWLRKRKPLAAHA
jgi:hypothetical protein